VPDEPVAHARIDLEHAVQVADARSGWLLSAGERQLLARWWRLSSQARSLYARLRPRRPLIFRVDDLHYAEVPDAAAAAAELVEAGLALDDRAGLAPSVRATVWTVPMLKARARELGQPRGGRRADLVARLCHVPGAFDGPSLLLPLARPLFDRLVRLYLHRSSADLSEAVVERMGIRVYPRYTPGPGVGPFPDRESLRAYEACLRRAALMDGEAMIAEVDAAMARLEARPSVSPLRRRFSPRRFDEAIAFAGTQGIERRGELERAAALYTRLLAVNVERPHRVRLRLARCLGRLERPEEGLNHCLACLEAAPPSAQPGLARTGRRLARRARRPWRPLPPLRKAPERSLHLEGAPGVSRRPLYSTLRGAAPVEHAVIEWLAERGRRALHTEASPWSTLFGLLGHRLLFAPVPDALPGPWMRRPLDLGTAAFRPSRAELVDGWLSELRGGGGPALLEGVLAAHGDEFIAGVDLDRAPTDVLRTLTSALPGPALAGILEPFVDYGHRAARGLPDLCLLPGPVIHDATALPHHVSEDLLLVEVKGPGDSLRDEQRVWLDRLVRLGVRAEIWHVHRAEPDHPDGLAAADPEETS